VQDFVWEPVEIGSTSMDTPAAALAKILTVVADVTVSIGTSPQTGFTRSLTPRCCS
jgi:hypothetical protein